MTTFDPFCFPNRKRMPTPQNNKQKQQQPKTTATTTKTPVLLCIYINDPPLHIPSHAAECHMLADDITLHTTGKSTAQIQKTLQLSLVRISVWYNTTHMLNNPVKTMSVFLLQDKSASSQTCH